MKQIEIMFILFVLLMPLPVGSVLADGVSPAYLEVTERPNRLLEVTWKVPLVKGEYPNIEPAFPTDYAKASPVTEIDMKDSVVYRWNLKPQTVALAGQEIAIAGLDSTVIEVLARIKLKDGRVHRLVLRPNEPSTTVPLPEKVSGKEIVTSALIQTSQLRFLIVCLIGLILTLLAKARRRQYVLCLSALLVGSLFGHTIGTTTGNGRFFNHGIPSNEENVRILHGLLLNTYRSCQYEDEEHAYDQLARSVTGDLLTSIYLENRDMLNVGETEGAKSMIERVDVRTVEPIESLEDGAYNISANWDVYGSVSHWEHTHYRCNSYKAVLTVTPSQDYWKIANIEITDEERVL
ncbi:MAG: hypothetical protein ACYS8O_08155 [Planctomycetota bacterium]|jgi:hypothetical protein